MPARHNEVEVIDLTELTESSEGEEEEEDEEDSNDGASESASEQSVAQIPVDQKSRAQLLTAISTVNEQRLRQVLAGLIGTVPAVEMALTKELVTLKRKTQEVVPRWEICCKCEGEFDVNTEREEDECSFHPGVTIVLSISMAGLILLAR